MKDSGRRGLTDRVYGEITALVMDHEIEPGARVGIESLARRLEVSPTPVREALARLESDGLVTKRSQAGCRATELLSADGLVDLFGLRRLLEPRAAALAATHATHATDEQLGHLETTVEGRRRHPVTGERYLVYRRFAALDHEVHDTLAAASGRPLLAQAVQRLHEHLHMFRLDPAPGDALTTVDVHDRVLRAVLRRDPDRAAEAMAHHLSGSWERDRSAPDKPGSAP